MPRLLAIALATTALVSPSVAKASTVVDGQTLAELQVARDFWAARNVTGCQQVTATWVSGLHEFLEGRESVPVWGFGENCSVLLNPAFFARTPDTLRNRRTQVRALEAECSDVVQQVGGALGKTYGDSGVMSAWSPDTPWACHTWARNVYGVRATRRS